MSQLYSAIGAASWCYAVAPVKTRQAQHFNVKSRPVKTYPDKLAAQLAKGIASAYLLHGDEPLTIMEAGDAIRLAAREQGYSEREIVFITRDDDWEQVRNASDSLSLFAEQRIIDLRIPSGKPGRKGSEVLKQLLAEPAPDLCYLITTPKLDRSATSSAWFKAVDKAGLTIACWQLDYRQLLQWIETRLKARGLQPRREAVELMAERLEGNLLAAQQEIETLALLYPQQEIDREQVLAMVTKSARYPLGGAVDAALQGATPRALSILSGLRDESVPEVLLLWSFTQDIRAGTRMGQALARGKAPDVAFREAGVWKNRQPLLQLALSRHSELSWISMLGRTAHIDRMIKGMEKGDVWNEFAELCIMLGGNGTPSVQQAVYDAEVV